MNKLNLFIDKLKINFKKNKIILIILVCIWIIVAAATLFFYRDTLGKQSFGNERYENVIELYDGVVINEYMPVYDGSESVCIKLATYARKNNGKINVKVFGNNSRTLYVNRDVSTNSLQDNAFLTVKLDKNIHEEKDRFITITLTSDNTKENSVGVYCSNENVFGYSECKVNNNFQDGDLTVRFLTENKELYKFYTMLITWTIIGIGFIIIFMVLCEPKVEVLFAIIASVIGLSFCFLMTPLSIPDEFAHFEYSLQLSNYMMFEDNHLMIDGDYKDYGSYRGHHNVSSAYEKVMRRWNSDYNPDGVLEEMDNDIDGLYTLCFVPQTLGVLLARLLKLNRVKLFYLGRFCNLLFYVLCIYYSIKRTPIHKLLFGIIATLPIFMQQAASYSYDCFVNALSLLTISNILNFIYSDKILSNKDLFFALIINALLAPCKTVYGFFSFLFLFIPNSKYGNKKRKVLWSIMLCAPALYELFIITSPILEKVFKNLSDIREENLSYINRYNIISNNESFGVLEEKITIGYLLRHPIDTIALFARTIRFSLKNWIYDSMGRTLSGMTLVLPTKLTHLILIAPVIAMFIKEKEVETLGLKIGYIVICLFIVLYIMGGFLLSWTDKAQSIVNAYGGMIIQGIQGRYFCPLLPYALSVFNNKKIAIPNKYNNYIITIQLIVLFEVIVYVLSFTFVN